MDANPFLSSSVIYQWITHGLLLVLGCSGKKKQLTHVEDKGKKETFFEREAANTQSSHSKSHNMDNIYKCPDCHKELKNSKIDILRHKKQCNASESKTNE